ncbi:unnamed protein product [Rotaria sp. Silwood1]|nr:unnamed protein product [Rotaria sp. Silwood1]
MYTKWNYNYWRTKFSETLDKFGQLEGFYVDYDDQMIYICDSWFNRVVKWKYYSKIGELAAGDNGNGNQSDQLNHPIDLIIDKDNDSLIICDRDKRQVVRWKIGDTNRTIVAGGNGSGNHFNQLNRPSYLFVDQNHSVYISDTSNHRVMKWIKGAKEGILVAGGQGLGAELNQLTFPRGMIVDQFDSVYVADRHNHRIMRWVKGSVEGSVVVGGNGQGKEPNQLDTPEDLLFDEEYNLYVNDAENRRVQKFAVDLN